MRRESSVQTVFDGRARACCIIESLDQVTLRDVTARNKTDFRFYL